MPLINSLFLKGFINVGIGFSLTLILKSIEFRMVLFWQNKTSFLEDVLLGASSFLSSWVFNCLTRWHLPLHFNLGFSLLIQKSAVIKSWFILKLTKIRSLLDWELTKLKIRKKHIICLNTFLVFYKYHKFILI